MQKITSLGKRSRRKDGGYMLLVLMLAVAVLTITMLGVARNFKRGIQRDREVEMIHRGEQYARAVQKYYKKNHNYPLSIELLENSNNIRYLRKKYKDPMSPDGEWKIVHQADLVGIKGITGLTPTTGTGTGVGAPVAPATQAATTPPATSDPAQGTASAPGGTTTGSAANPVLGGGPMYGVVSKMKTEGIHSFGDKTKYNEWLFIYISGPQDTAAGRLLVGPYNPNMVMGGISSGTPNKNPTGSPNPGTGTPPATTMPPATTTPPNTTTP